MGLVKWKGKVAIVRASSGVIQPASGFMYPVLMGGEAVIEGEPIIYERNITPDVDYDEFAGHNFRFSISGIVPNMNMAGYLWALALGDDSFSVATHTITPDDDQQYLVVFIDTGLDLGTSTPTIPLLGCKIESLEMEIPFKGFAKCNISGPGCAIGPLSAALTPSIPSGADEKPIGWHSLKDAAGFFKLGLNGVAVAAIGTPKGLKISYGRPKVEGGLQLNTDQPTQIEDGSARTLAFEFPMEWKGTITNTSKEIYAAWLAGQRLALDIKGVEGAHSLEIVIPEAKMRVNALPSIGQADEIMMGIVQGQAKLDGTNPLVTVTAVDGSGAAYW